MINVSKNESTDVYDVRLPSSVAGLVLIGAITFLKNKSFVRVLSATIGFLLLILAAIIYLVPDLVTKVSPQLTTSRILLTVLPGVLGLGLLLASILSTATFNVFMGPPPEVEERREAEITLKDSKDPHDSLQIDTKRLNEYYAINQSQARGSFRWAVFAMFCGLATIVAGIWIFYLSKGKPDAFLTSLSTAAGMIVNVISGLYLYLHNKTQKRSLFYYYQLVRLQQLGLAIRLAESHTGESDKLKSKNKIIEEILSIIKSTAIQESKGLTKEAD